MIQDNFERELIYFKNISLGLSNRLDLLKKTNPTCSESMHIAGRLYAYTEIIMIFERMKRDGKDGEVN